MLHMAVCDGRSLCSREGFCNLYCTLPIAADLAKETIVTYNGMLEDGVYWSYEIASDLRASRPDP
jgi:hypothetical protein